MKPVIDYSIYLVTDTAYFAAPDFWQRFEAALAAGVTVAQYRDKTPESRTLYERALKMQALCAKYNVPLLINDRADIAFAAGAAGVHLGQDDLPVEPARRMLGDSAIIGVSAHNAAEARLALEQGADYLGCGAVYPSGTKKESGVIGTAGLKTIRAAVGLPFVGIGGVTLANYADVLAAGANGAAIVSAILGAPDIAEAVRRFKGLAHGQKCKN